jgi:para-nitrobenzyl esterase
MSRLSFVVAAAMLVAATTSVRAEISDPVRLDSGQISGVPGAKDGIRVFKGIPFAAPPVGELRWKDAQPVPKWAARISRSTCRARRSRARTAYI